MTEELEQLLKNLKLRRILEIYDEQLRAADKSDTSYSAFLTRLGACPRNYLAQVTPRVQTDSVIDDLLRVSTQRAAGSRGRM